MKKGLLIGINYTGTSSQLEGCINDVYNMRDFLTRYCGYLLENIKVLTDKDIPPNRQNIESHIQWLISDCASGDTLFFHYSGHGTSIRDTSGDETDKKDEVLVPLDFESKGFIVDDWLFSNFISKIPDRVTLYGILDCCHSGTAFDLKYNYNSLCSLKQGTINPTMLYNSKEWTEKYLYSLQKSREIFGNVCMFSGSLDPQTAEDSFISGTSQGAFTYCMLECLKRNIVTMTDGSQCFKSDSLKFRNILKEVNCRLKIGRYRQNTQLSVSKKEDLEKLFNP